MRTRIAAFTAAVTTAVVLTGSATALAQDEECPPGSWFCEDVEPAVDLDEDVEDEVEQPAPPEEVEVPKQSQDDPPPIVVYKPEKEGDPAVVVVDRRRKRNRLPPPKKRREKSLWGLNLHLQGAMMGSDDEADKSKDSGMGGFGFGLRYRPRPHFAFELGLDFLGGRDYQGDKRAESALLFNGIVFFNPKDKVQVYGLGGFGFSGARVLKETQFDNGAYGEEEIHYSYFGLQMGLGLEFRIGKRTALNLDVLGFIRGRTDDLADEEYEFVDEETGQGTNTSGGGLFRGGITFYW